MSDNRLFSQKKCILGLGPECGPKPVPKTKIIQNLNNFRMFKIVGTQKCLGLRILKVWIHIRDPDLMCTFFGGEMSAIS